MNGHSRQETREHPSNEDDKRGDSKRKGEDEASTSQTRAKRNRYISLACNECKRRKIKCNGETPCHRCGNLNLDCLYAPNCCSSSFKESEDFRLMNDNIHSLQDQVDNLYASLNALRNKTDGSVTTISDQDSYPHRASHSLSNPRSRYQSSFSSPSPLARAPQFKGGATSSALCFDVAKSSLQTMGIAQPEYGVDETVPEQTRASYDSPLRGPATLTLLPGQPTKDPIWSLRREEVVRLCRLFDEDVGMMHPILDIEKTISRAHTLFDFMESSLRTGLLSKEIERSDAFLDETTNILKMVLASALTLEGNGESELGAKLFQSVRSASESRLWEPVSLNGLVLLVIVAQYHFHLDQEAQAYRVIGLAARLCFEMGLHQYETLTKSFSLESDLAWAIRLFWSIYVLDRRWSFGMGMPFAIQDVDIDPALPQPDIGSPYLIVAVSFCRITSKVWRAANDYETTENKARLDTIRYLDHQILQWQKSIPEPLQFHPSSDMTNAVQEAPSRALRRFRVLMHLRGMHIRIFLHRPILHSATSIMENRELAQTVVDLAKDTINVLTELNQKSDIYRTQQRVFNWFLLSSLAVLFLAVSHAPVEFSRQVREEFYMALDIVKGFSSTSHTSKKLWKTIKSLKEIAPRLGVSRQGPTEADDPHSSAAVAMAGLAGHQVDRLDVYPHSHPSSSLGSSPMDGQRMYTELTNLFEAAGGQNNLLPPIVAPDGMGGYMGQSGVQQGLDVVPTVYGRESKFARIMDNCFLPGHLGDYGTVG
ncbi:hypothetical protein MMC30_000918 [Trapelia coarctata]|nr:hypothetical protein [Trapelia coarctata]